MSTLPSAPPKDFYAGCADFLRWSWTMLGWQAECHPDGSSWLHLPEQSGELGGAASILIAAGAANANRPASAAEVLDEKLFELTVRALRNRGEALHAAPACQPVSVHELTPRLFDAYSVEHGHVRLGGCILEDHPLLRMTYLVRSMADSRPHRLEHCFATADGQTVDVRLLDSLHVHTLVPAERPPRLHPGQLASWLAAAQSQLPATGEGEQAELVCATLVWCKHFHVKLLFEIGPARAELPFSGWAQWLTDGSISPPPFRCPASQRESYRVVATDDGRITVPEAVAVCEYSGRRALETDLEVCQVTARRVLAEFLRTCPVSAQRVLLSEMVACSSCAQLVSPRAVSGGKCEGCRSLRSVRRNDPRMARVFGEHPKLDQWSRWRLAETPSLYILSGSSFLRQLLVVLDKESLDVRRLAESSFLSRRWSPIAEEQWREFLG